MNDWDRLDLSRVSHQIFAETANAYFKKRLLSLSTPKGVSICDFEKWQTVFYRLTPMQTRHIKVFILTSKQYLKMPTYPLISVLYSMPRLRVFNIVTPSLGPSGCEMAWQELNGELIGCSNAQPYFVPKHHDSLELWSAL